MDNEERSEVTRLLRQAAGGDRHALQDLCNVVYDDLHQAAQRMMQQERAGHTLQPTALVNEAMLRLLDAKLFTETASQALFFGAAARAMRQVLVEHARRRNAVKRGKGWKRTVLDDAVEAFEKEDLDLERLDAALCKLEQIEERQHEVIQLRFFGGLAVQQIATLLQVSESTVEKDLKRARSFLYKELSDD